MKIQFYSNTAEQNRLNKLSYLTKTIDMDGTLRSACSITNPTIMVNINAQITPENANVFDKDKNIVEDDKREDVYYWVKANMLKSNYVYIEDFKRYYYIDNIVSVNFDLWQIEMHVDVLMSFKDSIVSLDAYVERNEFKYDVDIEDIEVIVDKNVDVEFTTIENDLFDEQPTMDTPMYTLTTVSFEQLTGVVK